MKKPYIKPFLGVEKFSLMQTAARDCAESIPKDQVTFNDIPKCVWNLGGDEIIFIEGSQCTIIGDDTGFVCYNNPSEGMYIFHS